MYQIIDKRGTGKTSRLLLLAKENNAVVVCNNPDAIRYKAESYGIYGLTFVSYCEFISRYDPDITTYVIDELDAFVNAVMSHGPRLLGYSLTVED